MKTVIVEVSGGVVQDVNVPVETDGTYVVIDWDCLLGDTSTPAETKEQWERFTDDIQAYIRESYPEDYAKILDAIKLADL
jgi:hypothetical protein